MKLKNYLLAGTALVALSFMAACSEDETIQNENNTENPGGNDGGDETNEDVIIWPGDTIANLTNHYTVPEGKTLIIKAGAKVIVSTAGVGANHAPIEFTVKGNLYCEGTAENLFYSLFLKMNVLKKMLWQVCGEVLLQLLPVEKC